MTDDIVTRLENACAHPCDLCRRENAYVVGEDAADEIERLRADIEERAKFMSKIAQLLLPYSLLMNKDEQKLLIKAVRGDT